jgi:hypothetical protein
MDIAVAQQFLREHENGSREVPEHYPQTPGTRPAN